MGKNNTTWEADARRLDGEAKSLRLAVNLFKERLRNARSQLHEASSLLDHATFAVVTTEAKRFLIVGKRKLDHWLENDDRYGPIM